MPQELEIPQVLPRSRQTIELPSLFAGPPSPYPFTQSGTSEPGLRQTPEDPAMAAAGAATGGGAFLPGLLKGLFFNAAINSWLPSLDKTLEQHLFERGRPIPEEYSAGPFGAVSSPGNKGRGNPQLPKGGQADYYTAAHRAATDEANVSRSSRYPTAATERFRGGKYYPTRALDPALELPDESLLRANAAPLLGPTVRSKLGTMTEPRNPLDLIWHGLSLGGDPWHAAYRLGQIQESPGLHSGWFANAPAGNFGPFLLGADPNDLPAITPRRRYLRVDPLTELIPNWGGDPERAGLSTVSGREVPNISVHPSKLHVIDSAGNRYGTVADYRPGLEYGKQRPMKLKGLSDPRIEPSGKVSGDVGPEAHISWLKKQLTKDPESPWLLERLKLYEDALKSEMGPAKNWATQHLGDIRKLFGEAAEEVPK